MSSNDEGRHSQSSGDQRGPGAERVGNRDNDDRPQDPGQRNAPRPSNRRRQDRGQAIVGRPL
ncbi:hypothetical protein, partial [Mycobacterium intracellulare]|uniref:hypothetical protein n=1 Tax=Mycobacterium intracellulare TaxID=1767 RepID=UPI001F4342CE